MCFRPFDDVYGTTWWSALSAQIVHPNWLIPNCPPKLCTQIVCLASIVNFRTESLGKVYAFFQKTPRTEAWKHTKSIKNLENIDPERPKRASEHRKEIDACWVGELGCLLGRIWAAPGRPESSWTCPGAQNYDSKALLFMFLTSLFVMFHFALDFAWI